MSWQAYIDTQLVQTGHIDSAAIFSVAGDSVWARTSDFVATPDEVKKIISGFADSTELSLNGIYLNGVKYLFQRAEGRSIYGKQGKQGICIVKTKQALIIAHYPETVQPGSATNTTEKLADLLIKAGY